MLEVVVDAGRVIAATFRNGTCRRALFDERLRASAPGFLAEGLREHRKELADRIHLSEAEIEVVVAALLDRIIILPEAALRPFMSQAGEALGRVDRDDVAYVAAGLALGGMPIWTDDKHFGEQLLIKVTSTADLVHVPGYDETPPGGKPGELCHPPRPP